MLYLIVFGLSDTVMDITLSPLPLGWWSVGGHADLWGTEGTYQLIPYEQLPPVDATPLDGSFAWLPPPAADDDALDFAADDVTSPQAVTTYAGEDLRNGLSLPDGFTAFMTNPDLHRRVPTCTLCCLSFSGRLIDCPGTADGHLLRFMNDQQCVLLWYLYFQPGLVPAVAVGVPDFGDDAQGDILDDIVTPLELRLCAPTFEEFMWRFWMENTIWYSLDGCRPLTSVQEKYLDAVRRVRAKSAGL